MQPLVGFKHLVLNTVLQPDGSRAGDSGRPGRREGTGTKTTKKWSVWFVWMRAFGCAALLAAFCASDASAQECNGDFGFYPTGSYGGNWRFTNPNGRYRFRVNLETLDILNGVDRSDALPAIMMAAGTWNDQANGATFEYSGNTQSLDLPEDLGGENGCEALGVDYSIVTGVYNAGGSPATTEPRCRDANGDATQFHIKLPQGYSRGTLYFSTGAPTAGSMDLATVVTHEFGHAMNLQHPQGDWDGVMGYVPFGSNVKRDLFPYDINCADEVAGQRSLTAYKRLQRDGAWGSPISWIPQTPVADVSVGLTASTGTWRWASAYQGQNNMLWTRFLNSSNTQPFLDGATQYGIGPTLGVFREEASPKRDRIFFSGSNTAPYSTFTTVVMGYSTNGFGSESYVYLDYLDDLGTQPVASGKALSLAYDEDDGKTLVGWVNQTRTDAADSRRVMLSLGMYDDNTLNAPAYITGVKSTVTPGLACKDAPRGSYDCLVAYVHPDDPTCSIKTRRFNVSESSNVTSVAAEALSTEVDDEYGTTTQRIALWYHDSKWWLAFKSVRLSPMIDVYSSEDGANWVRQGVSVSSSVGPSIAGWWTQNHQLLYAYPES